MNATWKSLLLLACVSIPACLNSQIWLNETVSTDTLIAGQVNVIQMNVGFYDIGSLDVTLYYEHGNAPDDVLRCVASPTDTLHPDEIQPVNDTVVALTFNLAADAYPLEWNLYSSTGMWYSPMQMFTQPWITDQPDDQTVCLGGDAVFDLCAYGTQAIKYTWYHNVTEVQSKYNESGLSIENVEYSDTGSYYCELRGWNYAVIYSDTVFLHLHKIPEYQEIPVGPTFVNSSDGPAYYAIKYSEDITEYHWCLLPADAGVIGAQGDSMTTVTWNKNYRGEAGLFVETSMGECTGPNSDTLWIDVTGKPESPGICIVGLDEETEKCRIVWNPMEDPLIQAYNIYRESNVAGTFLKLVSIDAGGPTVFVDSSSVPNLFPQSYRLSVTDTSGIESDPGSIHTTMLLHSSVGTDGNHYLNWNHYIGVPFLSYDIYHGHSKDSMSLYYTVSSSVNFFTVPDPLPGSVHYQVVAKKLEDLCAPALKSGINYSETRSNVSMLQVHTQPVSLNLPGLEVSPNPAGNTIRIHYSGTGRSLDLDLLNLLGKVCRSCKISSGQAEIDVSGVEPGVYLLRLAAPDGIITRKLMIRR